MSTVLDMFALSEEDLVWKTYKPPIKKIPATPNLLFLSKCSEETIKMGRSKIHKSIILSAMPVPSQNVLKLMQYLGSALPFFHVHSSGIQFKQSAIVAENQNATTAASAIYMCILNLSLIENRRWSRRRMDSLVIEVMKKYSTDVENVILVYTMSSGVKT